LGSKRENFMKKQLFVLLITQSLFASYTLYPVIEEKEEFYEDIKIERDKHEMRKTINIKDINCSCKNNTSASCIDKSNCGPASVCCAYGPGQTTEVESAEQL